MQRCCAGTTGPVMRRDLDSAMRRDVDSPLMRRDLDGAMRKNVQILGGAASAIEGRAAAQYLKIIILGATAAAL